MSSETAAQLLTRLGTVRSTLAELEATPVTQYSIKDRQAIMQRIENLRSREKELELLYQRALGETSSVRYVIPRMH